MFVFNLLQCISTRTSCNNKASMMSYKLCSAPFMFKTRCPWCCFSCEHESVATSHLLPLNWKITEFAYFIHLLSYHNHPTVYFTCLFPHHNHSAVCFNCFFPHYNHSVVCFACFNTTTIQQCALIVRFHTTTVQQCASIACFHTTTIQQCALIAFFPHHNHSAVCCNCFFPHHSVVCFASMPQTFSCML